MSLIYSDQIFYRFARRSLKFMDAYRKGLNGKWAAWAAKKYHGHRVLPEGWMDAWDKAKKDESETGKNAYLGM